MPDPLQLEVRKKIYDAICRYPGIHMRELQRQTGLATGSLDYHLHFLHKHGLIRVEKSGRFTRYYSAMQAFSEEEKHVLSVLRQEKLRHIVLFLLQRKQANATRIAEQTGLQPSNLSGHLKTLEQQRIIEHAKRGRFRFYRVKDKEQIVRCLVAHRKSFLDQLVDNFIDAWVGEE